MAFKFGGALRSSLSVTKDNMKLIQMSPERIFRVETDISESVFRESMSKFDVASGGNILFIEIPTISQSKVELHTSWGNNDADSRLLISTSLWAKIKEGASYEKNAWAQYEGSAFSVKWIFKCGLLSVVAKDGRECIIDLPVNKIFSHVFHK